MYRQDARHSTNGRQPSPQQTAEHPTGHPITPAGPGMPPALPDPTEWFLAALEAIAERLKPRGVIADRLDRLEEALAPVPKEKIDTGYVADQLGVTKVYVAQMALNGTIPKGCIVQGTGRGKLWKFYRESIDRWIQTR
jgi:hypothetical protein